MNNGSWMCVCGDYFDADEWPFHCPVCKQEPPWGCQCDECLEPEPDETDVVCWNALCDEGFEVEQ